MTFAKIALPSALAVALATPSFAAMDAIATTDLNLRAGPGPQYAIQDVIAAEGDVTIQGCVEASDWCKVSYNGTEGWAYSAYLTAKSDNTVVYENTQTLSLETVTYENEDKGDNALGGAVFGGTAASLLIGGPAAIAAGALAGAITAGETTPDETVVTYVTENSVEPVYLNGEVAVGAGIPEEVQLVTIPENTEYAYLNVNDQYVLVNPENRRIVYVIR